jgi:phage gp29-like protein
MAILDQYGNPIDLGRLAEPQLADTAWLRREFDTHPAKGLTPAKLANILLTAEQGDWTAQLDLASDIEERDGHAFAELSKRAGSIAALEWSVEPPKGASAREKAWAAQLQDMAGGVPDFEDVLLEMMGGVLNGAAMHAMSWKPEGRMRLPKLQSVPARWFTTDATRNGLLLRSATQMAAPPPGPGMEGLAPVMGEPLRPLAWLVHTPRSRNGYLARRSLARVLAWPYLFKHYALRDLAEFLEIYGLPLRLGQYPSGASPEEKLTLLRAVTDIGHNAAGIIPQGMLIDFKNAAAGNDAPFLGMVSVMDAVQSKVILGQTLSSSEGKSGTQALGKIHEQVRMDIRATDARQIEGTLTSQLLVPMGIINIPGFDPKRAPRFRLDLGEGEDVTAYAESLPKLAGAGLRIPVSWAHEKLRIPQAEDGAPVMTGPAAAPAAPAEPDEDATGQPARARTRAAPAALAGRPTAAATAPAPDPIDALVAEQAAQWRPVLGPLVRPLLAELDAAVARGESLAAFAARLPQLVAQMDGTPMADDLGRAAFVAGLAGQADIDLAGNEGA